MGPIDLIDTTEMYLKTIYEMEEDGVIPMRARIVDRLGHSGPTVSQTIARMERDGLVKVRGDRRLELTDEGQYLAKEVMRKHRLAECLLVSVVGLEWVKVHEEACRWEHVMSQDVEDRLNVLLGNPTTDPYGNPIPGATPEDSEKATSGRSAEQVLSGGGPVVATLLRIGEPIQADPVALAAFSDAEIHPGTEVLLSPAGDGLNVSKVGEGDSGISVILSSQIAAHLFLTGS